MYQGLHSTKSTAQYDNANATQLHLMTNKYTHPAYKITFQNCDGQLVTYYMDTILPVQEIKNQACTITWHERTELGSCQ